MDFPILELTVTFLIGITAIIVFFWYSTRKHDYWKKRKLPYAKPLPVFGTILKVFWKPIHEADQELYQKLGQVFGYFEGDRPALMVADPVLLRDILVKDFQFFINRRHLVTGNEVLDSVLSNLQDEDWKRVRTIITPTFTTGKIKRMLNIFEDCAETLIKNLRSIAEMEKAVDVKSMYGTYTMDVIASSAFSTKIDSHNDFNNEFYANGKELFSRNNKWNFLLIFLFPKLSKIFGASFFSQKSMKFFEKIILQIIEQRKKTGETRNDFLQLLLDTSKESADENKLSAPESGNDDIAANYGENDNEQVFKSIYKKKNLTHTEIVAQCIIFFIAGYETTSSTLAFATYALALNEDIQEKLIKELDEALEEAGGKLTYEVIQGMKYLDNVISETLRLYPPAIRVARVANEDYELKSKGITVPKGMIVNVPVYAMHRDPNNYSDPEKFDPDRFNAEERAKRSPYLYLPFGAGPRNCIGMRFALIEVKTCLAHVLRHFRIKRCSDTKVPLEFYLGQGLLQPKEIKIQMEIRKDDLPNL